MSRPPANPALIPGDLCLFAEACCTPTIDARRWLLRALGCLAAALALAGAVLPLLPATPFALLAAWAFMRSSPRLEAWLMARPGLGAAITGWRARRAIPLRAKLLAAASLAVSLGVLVALQPGPVVVAVAAAALTAVGAWILTRPS